MFDLYVFSRTGALNGQSISAVDSLDSVNFIFRAAVHAWKIYFARFSLSLSPCFAFHLCICVADAVWPPIVRETYFLISFSFPLNCNRQPKRLG